MWIDNSQKPKESGYYLTYYRNTEKEEVRYLYKAFWYNVSEDKWIFRFDPDVKTYWDVRHEFYVPCQTQENVDTLPSEYRSKE